MYCDIVTHLQKLMMTYTFCMKYYFPINSSWCFCCSHIIILAVRKIFILLHRHFREVIYEWKFFMLTNDWNLIPCYHFYMNKTAIRNHFIILLSAFQSGIWSSGSKCICHNLGKNEIKTFFFLWKHDHRTQTILSHTYDEGLEKRKQSDHKKSVYHYVCL